LVAIADASFELGMIVMLLGSWRIAV